MPIYNVAVPVTGLVLFEGVEADDEDAAVKKVRELKQPDFNAALDNVEFKPAADDRDVSEDIVLDYENADVEEQDA